MKTLQVMINEDGNKKYKLKSSKLQIEKSLNRKELKYE